MTPQIHHVDHPAYYASAPKKPHRGPRRGRVERYALIPYPEVTVPEVVVPEVLPPGSRLGDRYVVHELIGDGGMAMVYRGEHEILARPVAIKVLRSEAIDDTPAPLLRFVQEARASSRIRHDNVVEVIDIGETDDGRPFMVMEYLEGEELGVTLEREGPLPWSRVQPMLVQILAALQASHEQRLIHRDIKPQNLFRTQRMGYDDFIKVFDFGIAKATQSNMALTLDGHTVGTPSYMSPEQCTGEPIDARSDIYSVGIVAYQMLTGNLPFDGEEWAQAIFSQLYEPVPSMAAISPSVTVDPRIEAVIRRALAKNRDERFSSAREFADALMAIDSTAPTGLMSMLRRLFRGGR